MDHGQWLAQPAITLTVDEVHTLLLRPKVFSSGSRGFYVSGKCELNGERCQVSCCVTVIGSKSEGATNNGKRQDVQTKAKRSGDLQGQTLLSDGSELVEVIPEAAEAKPARRKAMP